MNGHALVKRARRALSVAACILVAACGAKRSPADSARPRSDGSMPVTAEGALDEIGALEAELYRVGPLAGPDWCDHACGLGARICELSARICDLASKAPSDPTLASQCTDAHQRCARARTHIAAQCTCPATPASPH